MAAVGYQARAVTHRRTVSLSMLKITLAKVPSSFHSCGSFVSGRDMTCMGASIAASVLGCYRGGALSRCSLLEVYSEGKHRQKGLH